MQANTSQPEAVLILQILYKWVRTLEGPPPLATELYVWSLLYILREINHYWDVK